ncbi:MAG TPA: DUF1684 domain-containing protein [bacterium]|nr:DUF1684 domain-containing protein [bacterium]
MTAERLQLLDWRRQVFELYQHVRGLPDPAAAWGTWRAARDRLFGGHPMSPIPEARRGGFTGLPYFDYDPTARVFGEIVDTAQIPCTVPTSGEDSYRFTRMAIARFELRGSRCELELYWLEGYAGGVFLPFRDVTSGAEAYGAGRYLLDTVKGADLGTEGGRLILDFNFAYNPSCVYDPKWVCPLAPPPNRLSVPVRAGERVPSG